MKKTISVNDLRSLELDEVNIKKEFNLHYKSFKQFSHESKYNKCWQLCIDATKDLEILSHIIFCNDVLEIPPVKTFLTIYQDDFNEIVENNLIDIKDNTTIRSIGAFWGTIFKFILIEYNNQQTVSISMKKPFIVGKATRFIK